MSNSVAQLVEMIARVGRSNPSHPPLQEVEPFRHFFLPDGMLDDRIEIFRSDLGLIVFPHRRPFDSDTTFTDAHGISTAPLRGRVPGIYEYDSQTEKFEQSRYYLQLASWQRRATVDLGYANIRAGTERIDLQGRRLRRNVDYLIDYDLGRVTFLTGEALDCNADIVITLWPQWMGGAD